MTLSVVHVIPTNFNKLAKTSLLKLFPSSASFQEVIPLGS